MVTAAYSNNSGSGLLAVPTYTQINKINGGLFGYRDVSTGPDTNGNSITICKDPGIHRCRIKPADVVTGGGLNEEQLEEIDNLVTAAISPANPSGQFMYGTDYLIVYTYDVNTNQTIYTIYTYAEAVALGLL